MMRHVIAVLLLSGLAYGETSDDQAPIVFEKIGEEEEEVVRESGMRFGLGVHGALAFGSLGEALGPGLGGSIWLGYEAAVGPTGLVPRLSINYTHFFTGESVLVGVTEQSSASTLTVFPGMVLTVRMPARPWVGFGFGYGRIALEQEAAGVLASSEETGFGVALQGGIEFRINEAAMLGLQSDYTLILSEVENKRWMTFGLAATFFL